MSANSLLANVCIALYLTLNKVQVTYLLTRLSRVTMGGHERNPGLDSNKETGVKK